MPAEVDAITLLKKDHELVKDLMKKMAEEDDPDQLSSMFEQLVDELGVHERIEEAIFYPALQRLPKAKEDVLEAFEEHHVVDAIVTEMDVETDDDKWKAKFTVMRENVEHHIKDEEDKLFPKAEKLLGDEKLGALGVQMADLKEAEQNALAEDREEEEEEQETTSSG
ncbi:MAG TPA: hemerythrin domain-containing protein [Candidatus Acidoferrales bacterium]|nr:hemerythrin domain-containing protein [Candidatus Acidoferrales bacterium]